MNTPGDEGSNRYRILRRVGAGGMSTVFAAHDSQLGKDVALKLLKKDPLATDDGERRRVRMMREAQALKLLSHENVVRVFDVGNAGDQLFITMELIEGSALRDWVREKPRTLRNILDVFIAAGRGLAAAHERGLVHRDFKPGNVLVSSDGRVVVTDFGLVRFGPEMEELQTSAGAVPTFAAMLGAPLTAPGAVIGTPGYMAPEQIQGQSTDHRTDQFAFCVALYEALYGERPFAPATEDKLPPEIALALAVVQGEVRPEPAGSQVPAELRATLLKGLSAKADDRFVSMSALLDELSTFEDRAPRGPVIALGAIVALLVIASIAVIAVPPPDPCAELPRRGETGAFFEEWNTTRDVLCGPVFAKDLGARRAARACLEARMEEIRAWNAAGASEVAALALTPPSRCASDPRRIEEGTAPAVGDPLDGMLRALAAGDDLARFRFHLAVTGTSSLSKDQLYARAGRGPRSVHALHALGHLYASRGRSVEALAAFEAMVLAARDFGDATPHVAVGLEAAGRMLLELGRASEAVDRLSNALALYESMPPDQRAARARVEAALASALSARGDQQQATVAARRAAALIEELDVPNSAELLLTCGIVLGGEGERLLEKSITLARDERTAANAMYALGSLFLEHGQLGRAVETLTAALARVEKSMPGNDILVREVLTSLAIAELETGASAPAATRLERALALSRAHGDSRERSARIRFTLARALVAASPNDHGVRERAVQLARSAIDELAAGRDRLAAVGGQALPDRDPKAGGDPMRARREEIAAWIAAAEGGS